MWEGLGYLAERIWDTYRQGNRKDTLGMMPSGRMVVDFSWNCCEFLEETLPPAARILVRRQLFQTQPDDLPKGSQRRKTMEFVIVAAKTTILMFRDTLR